MLTAFTGMPGCSQPFSKHDTLLAGLGSAAKGGQAEKADKGLASRAGPGMHMLPALGSNLSNLKLIAANLFCTTDPLHTRRIEDSHETVAPDCNVFALQLLIYLPVQAMWMLSTISLSTFQKHHCRPAICLAAITSCHGNHCTLHSSHLIVPCLHIQRKLVSAAATSSACMWVSLALQTSGMII